MTTIRSYQCNFCREEYSEKSGFRDINDIIGLKWETRSYGGTPYDKVEMIEVLKEVNRHEAENHLCKRCLETIKNFMPSYMTNEDRKNLISISKKLLESLGYEVKKKENLK